jgi:cell shape-determining protein MreC
MALRPMHERSRRRSFGRGAIFLALAAAAALLAPLARLFGATGGPLFAVERAVGAAVAPLAGYLSSKSALAEENRALQESVERLHAAALERDSLAAERDALAAELHVPGREETTVTATVLLRPPQTAFDSLVLGAGAREGVAIGDPVLAQGMPVGVIVETRGKTSVATLFSAPESRLAVTVGSATAEAVGQGDGRYSVEVPTQLAPATGTPVLSVAHAGKPIGFVAAVVPGEGEATVEALISLPVDLSRARYLSIDPIGAAE